MKTATRKDWKILPMPGRRSLIPVDRQFGAEEMKRIKRGVIPEAMEDKWFIYFERDRLYFHRSWTGFRLYVGHFKRKQANFALLLIEANRNAKQYTEKDDARDARLFFYLTDLLLLGRSTPFPGLANESDEQTAIRQWTEVGRAMLSEPESIEKDLED